MKKRAKPAPPVPRDETKQQTRAALVNAALELFAEQGLDVPSLDAICDRAGYTRGAFYVHFKSREEILVAVMEQVGAMFLSSMFEGLGADGPAEPSHAPPPKRKRLHHAVKRFVDAVSAGDYPLMSADGKRPLVRPHQLLDACARSPEVRERYRGMVQMSVELVSSLVRADQEDGDLRPDVEPAAVASIALALIIGAQTMADVGFALHPRTLGETIEKLLKP